MGKALFFDEICTLPAAMGCVLLPLKENWTPELHEWTCDNIEGSLASFGHVQDVLGLAPRFAFLIAEVSSLDEAPAVRGFTIFLPLNKDGHDALLDGRFDGTDINHKFISVDGQEIDALYWWCTVAPSALALGMVPVVTQLQAPDVRRAPIYTKPATDHVASLATAAGFVPVENDNQPNLFVCKRIRIGKLNSDLQEAA